MQVWNVLHRARWKYRTQKVAILAPSHNFVGLYLRNYQRSRSPGTRNGDFGGYCWTDMWHIHTEDVFGPSLGPVWRSRSILVACMRFVWQTIFALVAFFCALALLVGWRKGHPAPKSCTTNPQKFSSGMGVGKDGRELANPTQLYLENGS